MLQLVILMAGSGTRFQRVGYGMPKPLIPVDGLPMFAKAMSSLGEVDVPFRWIGIIRHDHVIEHHIDQEIHSIAPGMDLIVLPSLTGGAAESALAASELLDHGSPLVVVDCDLWFQSAAYEELLSGRRSSEDIDAAVLTFTADSARYSFVRTNPEGEVLEIAEKRVISDKAVAGAYYFAEASSFLTAASHVVSRTGDALVGEHYMSDVVGWLISREARVLACPVDEYASFGTPEELAHYTGAEGP